MFRKASLYIIQHADTRPLELFLAFKALIWGLMFLAGPDELASAAFWQAVSEHGGAFLWGIAAITCACAQALSIYWRYPAYRRITSGAGLLVWLFMAFSFMGVRVKQVAVTVTLTNALGCAWLVWHKIMDEDEIIT